MTAAAARRAPAPHTPARGLDDAFVEAAEIVAGHDGAAELLVRLRHGNGAVSAVALDPSTGFDLLRAAGAESLDGLVGLSWRDIIKGLWRSCTTS
ncbi:MAG TPA: hypothetical protein VFE13_02115 [Caulobacteraceae bacterium]|jgi:hypothetical protein|nr:hypothetical protein [Caulobacteraceae bacterium]